MRSVCRGSQARSGAWGHTHARAQTGSIRPPDWVPIRRNRVATHRGGRWIAVVFVVDAGPNCKVSTNGIASGRVGIMAGGSEGHTQRREDRVERGQQRCAGRGRSSRTTPPHLRVPALHASGAGRGISRACSARRDGHWAAGSGVHRSNVDGGGRSGNDGATGAALHSVRSGVGPDYEVVLGRGGPPKFWRSHRRHAGRAAPPVGELGGR